MSRDSGKDPLRDDIGAIVGETMSVFERIRRRWRQRRFRADVLRTLRHLFTHVAMTEDEELGCEECFELLDEYAELLVNGEDAGHILPLVRLHLRICGDCHEELATLLRAMGESPRLADR